MNKKLALSLMASSLIIGLTGCQATGEQYKATSYQVSALNHKQEAKTINIIAVTAAQVQVDNSQAKKTTTAVGSLLGSVAGAFIGDNQGETLVGGLLGGVAGSATGLVVSDTIMVEGVTLTYSEKNKIFTSTQIGRSCEFKPGVALVVSTEKNETRVQPNSVCVEQG
ncbi:hypothetical protein NGM67_08950 [Photobacterium damselae]|uniref:hypothetical protein n=1 Tax=Photobacterium damselae TaxID=38293 RepID=UPI00209149EB|nr:hypothetical protein [Photobacterium damselae]USR77890.1 hypothetical protein NGM67_08950 [Photobacterium damselae]